MHLRSELQLSTSSSTKHPFPTLSVVGKRKGSEQSKQLTSFPPLKRTRLTHNNLQAYCESLEESNTIPRKKKSDSGNSQTESQSSFTTTGNRFGQQLSANGVVHARWEAKPPKDFDQIKAYLDTDRASASPEPEDWQDYLEAVGESRNEATLQLTTWYKVAKPPPGKGYLCDANFEWTEVEGPVTARVGNAKPDITESYRLRKYPQQAIDNLGAALAPTSHAMAMPTFAVEAKSIEKGIMNAELQCAYDGAIMVDAARNVHESLGKRFDSFWMATQALTLAYNGNDMTILANHAVESTSGVQRHSYPLFSDTPRHSFEHFKLTRKHTRNAQDWSRKRATKILEELRDYDRALGPITPPQSDLTSHRDDARSTTRRRMLEVVED
jgi:hypothetical protein